MPKDARRDKNRGARRKFNHKAKVEQNQMSPKNRVEITERCNRTQSKRNICGVRVIMRCSSGPEVKSASGIDADVREVGPQIRKLLVERTKIIPILMIDLREVE